MIFRFAKCDTGPLFEMTHHFGRKIVVAIEPGANCGPAEREFLQRGNRLLRAPFPKTHLLRVTAKFLAESHRSRVHQMGATDFDHVVELGRFRRKGGGKFFEGGNETLLDLLGRADVDRGWNHVVARLTHVHVIVRVNRLAGADRFAGQLAGAIGDAFVRVRVRARAEPVWKMSEWKMLVELSLRDLLGRLHDERAPFRIEQTKIVIGLCGGPLQQAERG